MGRKGGVWGFLRGLGRRKSSVDDPLAGFVTIEVKELPTESEPGSEDRPGGEEGESRQEAPPAADRPPIHGAEAALTEAVTHCVHSYIKPTLLRLGADESLIQHPTSRVVLAALVGYWLLAVGSSLVLLVAALVAPALRSVRALESGDSERRRRWLRYWTVYAVVATVSTVGDLLHGLIPGYWTAKTLLLLWCAAPYPWHGSDYVFYHLIVPGWRQLAELLQSCTGCIGCPSCTSCTESPTADQ